jgi:hypothetical protein
MLLDDEQFYKNRLALCEQDGWRDLVAELKNLEDQYNNLDSIESEKDLWYARGQLSILRQVIALEDAAKITVEELGF